MELKKDIKWRMYLLYVFACAFGIAILFSVFKIQLVEGDQWAERAAQEKYSMRTIPAARGNIYSDDESLLATSVPIYRVHVDLNAEAITDDLYREKGDSLIKALSTLFAEGDARKYAKLDSTYKARFKDARANGKRYTRIHLKVHYDQLQEIKTFPILRRGRYKGGLIIEQDNKREKPFGQLAFRTIGFDREGIKPVGLEGAYRSDLRGQDGKRLMKKISGGVWMPINDDNEIEPQDGANVYTTININYQDLVEQSLMDQLALHNADHGCAVLMEVETGYVKAIANLKKKRQGVYQEDYNFAVGESTEPGSTFKLMSLISALDDDLVNITDIVDCEDGSYDFYDVTMHDSKHGGYGPVPIKDAFAHSSNIGMAKMIRDSYQSDQRKFTDRLHLVGLSQKMGLEIAGEGAPLIKNAGEGDWSGISITQMAIGYELQMTPLQILALYNAVANDGKMVRPTFVKEVRRKGKVIRSNEPVVINEAICSSKTIGDVKECLEAVVDYGTGKSLKSDKFRFAGKTGTARIAKGHQGYVEAGDEGRNYSYQASFCGYFPAEKPRYSLIVVINAPTEGVYYGAKVAGPVWKEIAEKVYASSLEIHESVDAQNAMALNNLPVSRHGYQPDLQRVFSELDVQMNIIDPQADYVTTHTGDTEVDMKATVQEGALPNVVGMGLMDALYLLENKGKKVKVIGSGVVRKQYPRADNPNVIVLELS